MASDAAVQSGQTTTADDQTPFMHDSRCTQPTSGPLVTE
jgi:hypothetical protein